MIRMDINGNTTSNDRRTLQKDMLRRDGGTYEVDSVGRVSVNEGFGYRIIFFAEDEPYIMTHLGKYFFQR